MRNTQWLWFAGFLAWLLDGIVNSAFHAWGHARLAFLLAAVFFAAFLFYRYQRR